jgi:phenylacetate-coenzyme A ligase PaaK-like adenylate-forming protein
MMERISIGDFLEQNEQFQFQVPEYFASKALIERLQERFASFRDTFCSAGACAESPWQVQRERIMAAAEAVPAYAGIDWQRSDYWRDIPLLDKARLRARHDDYRSPRYQQEQLWFRDTSGTSGPPMVMWYAPEFAFEFVLFAEAKVAWLADAWTPEILERAVLSAALVDKKSLVDLVWTCPDGSRGLTIRTLFDERRAEATDELLALLEKHRPALLALKPNILGSIARGIGQRKAVAADYLRLVLSGGAILDGEVRRAAQEALGVPVYDAYGLTEIGSVASECRQQCGLHVYENDVIAEVLLADASLHHTGRGELVLSSVLNDAMPLLRYRTGDLVELTDEPCACGRPGRRIVHIAGRAVRNYVLADGSEYAPTNFNELFKRFPIREFQITQLGTRELEAHVEPLEPLQPGEAAHGALLAQVREYMEKELRFQASVAVATTSFSVGDKLQRFRSLL